MNIQKINWKFYIADSASADPAGVGDAGTWGAADSGGRGADPAIFFKVFNTWISGGHGCPSAESDRDVKLSAGGQETFVDVADYSHVHDGPITALVGHYEDYWLDATGRRPGILYNRRQPMPGTNEEKIRMSLRSILKACLRIEQDPAFGGSVRFRTDEILFMINDRGIAPNTKSTYDAVRPELDSALSKVFAENSLTFDHLGDPRRRFAVKISVPSSPPLQDLIGRI